MGVCLWEIMERQRPWADVEPNRLSAMVALADPAPKLTLSDGCDERLQGLIDACMAVNPAERPDFGAIRETLTSVYDGMVKKVGRGRVRWSRRARPRSPCSRTPPHWKLCADHAVRRVMVTGTRGDRREKGASASRHGDWRGRDARAGGAGCTPGSRQQGADAGADASPAGEKHGAAPGAPGPRSCNRSGCERRCERHHVAAAGVAAPGGGPRRLRARAREGHMSGPARHSNNYG